MNLFFGKISQKIDTEQLNQGYYSSDKGSSWFGELKEGDYVFMIGGDRIQFWKASEWGVRNGRESLIFDVLSTDLGINVSQLIALKFLQFTKSLAVLTSRSARNKAFFELEPIKDIQITDLCNPEYYKNPELYRTIRIIKPENLIVNSEDFQLIYENGKLELADAKFIDNPIKKDFIDNLDKKGKGAVMKDNVLEFFSNSIMNLPSNITYRDIGLRSFYDTFFCDYKEKSIIENEDINYWVFQGSPKIFDSIEAVNANAVKTWTVSSHKDKIKKGDKFILWLTGVNAGCYALGRVASEVMMMKEANSEMNYYLSPTLQTDNTRVKVVFEHNLTNNPILWENIKDNPAFATFKGSNQGTNFTSTEEEYNTLLNMANSTSKAQLNQILYGPPGTGKTYHTKEAAVGIANPKFIIGLKKGITTSERRKAICDEYDVLFKAGQIVFTTFHQSMSYEDFVEGIKPIPPTSENSSINYRVEPGIFKNLCKRASEEKGSRNFDEAYSQFVNDVTESGTIELKSLIQKKPFNVRINSNETAVAIPKTEIGTEMGITKDMMRDYVVNGVIKDWKTYTTAIGEYFKSKYKINVENVDNTKKNYVLIIDEINRGNVSSIFGELITLLEADKRIGGKEQILLDLPYSKNEKFGVPPNLYIIGTMNTADRSVEALDTALRRRFCFTELMPDEKIVEEKAFIDFPRKLIMTKINDRIELLLDRNHTLGHAYFIKESFENSFKNEIIPLLQEYFYNDYGKIGLVLGKGFVREKSITKTNNKSIFADFYTRNEVDISKTYELIPFDEVAFEAAIKTLLI